MLGYKLLVIDHVCTRVEVSDSTTTVQIRKTILYSVLATTSRTQQIVSSSFVPIR